MGNTKGFKTPSFRVQIRPEKQKKSKRRQLDLSSGEKRSKQRLVTGNTEAQLGSASTFPQQRTKSPAAAISRDAGGGGALSGEVGKRRRRVNFYL